MNQSEINTLFEKLSKIERYFNKGNPYHAADGKFTFAPANAKYNAKGTNGPDIQVKLMKYLYDKHPGLFNKSGLLETPLLRRQYNTATRNGYKKPFEDFAKDIVTGTIWKDTLEKYTEGNMILAQITDTLSQAQDYTDTPNNTLLGLINYVQGGVAYGKKPGDRKRYDEEYGISSFIDSNKDIHYKTDKPIYRGLTTTSAKLKDFKVGSKIDMNGCSSWTSSESVAQRFLESSLIKRGKEKIILQDITTGPRKAMIYPFSSTSLASNKNQNEILYSGSNKFVIKNIEKKSLDGEDVYYVSVIAE